MRRKSSRTSGKAVAAIDLFCGIGGLTHGLLQEGITVVAGIDIDPTCRYAYESNNLGARFIERDIRDLAPAEIEDLYPQNAVRVLAGCAPCQPFSRYSKRYRRGAEDSKWTLVSVFSEIVTAILPDIVTMENVPELVKHAVFTEFVNRLSQTGFYVWHDIIQCADYGVPQLRSRLVLLASRFGHIRLIRPTHAGKRKTVAQAIGHLEPIAAGTQSIHDPLHRASGLSEINLQRIAHTPEGGTWRDWPSELVLECHKRKSGKSYGSIYGRMRWDNPSPTITTEFHGLGSGRFGHPEQNRAISIREGALLQSFPRSYKFVPPNHPYHISTLARHIGNAVPVRLGRIIGRTIEKHLISNGLL